MSPDKRSISKPSPSEESVTAASENIKSFCLTKSQRLKTPADFQRVYSSKQWGGSKHFTFNVLSNDTDQKNTLGVTVSKKVSKRAVDRNYLKRIMREYFRLHQIELTGANLVLTAKPSSRRAGSTERLESLDELWVKVLKWQRWNSRELIKSRELAKISESNDAAELLACDKPATHQALDHSSSK
jgi:ribonuclease P protein component